MARGNGRLEEALTALVQAQAILVQNHATMVQTQAAFAARDVCAISVTIAFTRFTDRYRTRQGMRGLAIGSTGRHSRSPFITVRSTRIARHTRWRTASDVVPSIAAASVDEYPA